MGQEIQATQFDAEAFEAFAQHLDRETRLLSAWEKDGLLCCQGNKLGFELEGWLVDQESLPAPCNQAFIETADSSDIVPELAKFNFELNTAPVEFGSEMFQRMYAQAKGIWEHCDKTAETLKLRALSIGILPTLELNDLNLQNISGLSRYQALNEQVFRLRYGRPIELGIKGKDSLHLQHHDVMLEAATTSLQVHLQVGSEEAVRAFNLSKILSAPLVAVGANSPFFLQRQLWSETRIPLFEQSVAVAGSDYSKRVTFGIRYAEDSLLECFEANRDRYPILLPALQDKPTESLAHLQMHNGTIWRWNRPLVGFDEKGRPHYRIEQRVMAAPNSAIDLVANTAFYVGLMSYYLSRQDCLESVIAFSAAHRNFYLAARQGLSAKIAWTDGKDHALDELICEQLIPNAREGLTGMGLHISETSHWLGVVEERVKTGQTGSEWQLNWVQRYGPDWAALVEAYSEQQATSKAVYQWKL